MEGKLQLASERSLFAFLLVWQNVDLQALWIYYLRVYFILFKLTIISNSKEITVRKLRQLHKRILQTFKDLQLTHYTSRVRIFPKFWRVQY